MPKNPAGVNDNESAKIRDATPVPIRLAVREANPLLLRQEWVSCEHGSVDTTAGLGGSILRMTWKGRVAVVDVRDIWAAWVATFDRADAERIATGPLY